MHKCISHELPVEVGQMMNPAPKDTWPKYIEDNIDRSAAAWSWLHKCCELREQGVVVDIGSGRMSKFVQNNTIVRRAGEDQVYAAMGNYLWAALGMPLKRIEVSGKTYWKFQRAPIEFLHVYDPSNWVVLPFVETRLYDHGLVLQQDRRYDDGGVPLVVNTLREGFHKCLGQHTTTRTQYLCLFARINKKHKRV